MPLDVRGRYYSVKTVFAHSVKGSTLKEINLLPRVGPIPKGINLQESKQEVIKIISSVENGGQFTKYTQWP